MRAAAATFLTAFGSAVLLLLAPAPASTGKHLWRDGHTHDLAPLLRKR